MCGQCAISEILMPEEAAELDLLCPPTLQEAVLAHFALSENEIQELYSVPVGILLGGT